MARAAKITIVEAEHIVEIGEIAVSVLQSHLTATYTDAIIVVA